MTAEELITDRKAVVKIVNKIRKTAGMGSTSRLSRGVRMHPHACTIAMSLNGTGITQCNPGGFITRKGAPVPFDRVMDSKECETIRRFMDNYDRGLYPELEIPNSEVKVKGEVVA